MHRKALLQYYIILTLVACGQLHIRDEPPTTHRKCTLCMQLYRDAGGTMYK